MGELGGWHAVNSHPPHPLAIYADKTILSLAWRHWVGTETDANQQSSFFCICVCERRQLVRGGSNGGGMIILCLVVKSDQPAFRLRI